MRLYQGDREEQEEESKTKGRQKSFTILVKVPASCSRGFSKYKGTEVTEEAFESSSHRNGEGRGDRQTD